MGKNTMGYSYPKNLSVKRNRNADVIKGGLLLGGLTITIVAFILLSLNISADRLIDPQLSCFQSVDGMNCKLL